MAVNEQVRTASLRAVGPDETKVEPARPSSFDSLVRALRERAERLRFRPSEAVALSLLGVLVLAGATLAYARARPTPAVAMAPVSQPQPSGEAVAGGSGAVFVHVVGAVRKPGVYELREGARVIDAVRAAGGMARSADATAVNLARSLTDGEQLVVPKRGEATAGTGTATGAGPASGGGGAAAAGGTSAAGAMVNINLAGAGELDSLPGIGPVLAERIVDYREQHGPFRTVRDLMKVSGIGSKKFESLEPHVTV